MDEIISYKMCAVKVRNEKLRNYLNTLAGLAKKYPKNGGVRKANYNNNKIHKIIRGGGGGLGGL
jgi:hypothetical protein